MAIDLILQNQKAQHLKSKSAAIDFLNENLENADFTMENFVVSLKDGCLLCMLLNNIQPGLIRKKFVATKLPFVSIQNMSYFTQGCIEYGVSSSELFSPSDLLEERSIKQVITTILAIKRVKTACQKRNSLLSVGSNESMDLFSLARDTQKSPPMLPLAADTNSNALSIDEISSVQIKSSGLNTVSSASSSSISPIKQSFKSRKASLSAGAPKDCILVLGTDKHDIITQYQLGNCIGRGQFGSVYSALDLATGQTVAIKRISLIDKDPSGIRALKREINLLKRLQHPNIVQYYGYINDNGYMNIILEYIENGSLLSLMRTFTVLPEMLVAQYITQVLHGLVYLHSLGVVHCDLKAGNILATKNGDVLLTDFGVSKQLSILDKDTGTVSGSPYWMAPEIITLDGASTKSDIWSLGCTIIELLTGKPPYADLITMTAMFRIVEEDRPPFPDGISASLRALLLQCFQKSPEARSTAAELLEHEWIKAAGSLTTKKVDEGSIANSAGSCRSIRYPNRELRTPRSFRTASQSSRDAQLSQSGSSYSTVANQNRLGSLDIACSAPATDSEEDDDLNDMTQFNNKERRQARRKSMDSSLPCLASTTSNLARRNTDKLGFKTIRKSTSDIITLPENDLYAEGRAAKHVDFIIPARSGTSFWRDKGKNSAIKIKRIKSGPNISGKKSISSSDSNKCNMM